MSEEIITGEVNNETEEALENDSPERVVVFEEALEAVLFAAGHPMSYSTLARVFEMTPGEVKTKVLEYAKDYNATSFPRGVILLTYPDSCQLSTKQFYLTEIRNALGIKKSGTLSTSSMETLAIIAYNQPVTRFFVDTLRRVDSSYAMTNLLDRGLIESKGRVDAPGRPMLYGTTKDFLRCFGLSDLDELPGTSDELMAVFDKAKITAENTDAEGDGDELLDETEVSTIAPQIQMELEELTEEVTIEPSADEDDE